MDFIKPYNDTLLEWNEETQKYRLTLAAIKNLVGNAYKDDQVATKRSILTSLNIYTYIYNLGATPNKVYTEFIINYTKQGRSFIYECLMAQILADSESGYNDISNSNGIDFTNGSIISREEIRKNKVCVNAEDLILNSASRLEGYNVAYMGYLNIYTKTYLESQMEKYVSK